MIGRTTRAGYLTAGLALAVLLVAVAGAVFALGRSGPTTDENGMGSMMGDEQMGSMTGANPAMGSSDEKLPFDLRFIDQMVMHHEGAIMSSEHMISDSKRPELRQLAEDIQQSQSEQIEQMRTWRDEWYGEAGGTSGMMGDGDMGGMMGGSMRGMMSGDMTDAMFLGMMIPHHQVAVEMSEEALDEAEHPELKELAQKIIGEQTAEIELMQGYLEEIEKEATR